MVFLTQRLKIWGILQGMPRYMIAPATLLMALVVLLGVLLILPCPAASAHTPREHFDLLLRLLSGRA